MERDDEYGFARFMMRTRSLAIALTLILALAWASAACNGRGRAGSAAAAAQGLQPAGLAAMIDSLLPVISRASGLPIRRPVAYALQSRADARKFIAAQLDDEMAPEDLHGTERVYKALGLIPDTMDLRSFLLDLYTEQVIGYYDPKTDRLYVLKGVAADSAAPVIAHELVHALQDQYTNLDSLVAGDLGNDRQLAAQAAAEGEATLVMIALQTAHATGKAVNPGTLPDMSRLLGPALEAQNDRFPVFQRAPRIIKETLLFPYLGGAGFVQSLFRHRRGDGIPVPFRDLLPRSTEQVLHPVEDFIDARDAPTELALGDPGQGWRTAYSDGFGELEISIVLEQYLGDAAAADARGWDGDRYALLDGPDGEEALAWYSVWDDGASADRFAAAYRDVLRHRPERTGTVERFEFRGRPVVKVVETVAGGAPAEVPVPAIVTLHEGP